MNNNIYFLHANGFPGACYRKFLQPLTAHYQVFYAEQLAHQVDYPITKNWHYLVQEALADLSAKTTEPVIAVGHSFGGVLGFLAAIAQPERFKMLILLDSPVLDFAKSQFIRLAKYLGFIDYLTPAARTRKRRNYWANLAEAEAYFASKPLFQTFDPDCLADYLRYGLMTTPTGLQLKFEPEVEYRIFRTLPHHLHRFRGQIKCPIALLYGEHSHLVTAYDRRKMQQYYQLLLKKVPGGHLFPFEHPDLAATVLHQTIIQLQQHLL